MAEEYRAAIADLRRAEQAFNDAEDVYIETAIARLTAAKLRVDAIVNERRKAIIPRDQWEDAANNMD